MVRGLLPLAQNAVDSMIATLSEPNANGGPLLDGRVEAIEELRKLHQALGDLLIAVDGGHLDDELGQNPAGRGGSIWKAGGQGAA
jgi:pentose-5-phosphate-3-epimerase